MKHKKLFFTMMALALLAAAVPASAQRRDDDDDDRERRESRTLRDRIWFGGGIGLGFSSFNGQSAFGIGISPMAGYKLLPTLSIGPRVAINYTAQKVPGIQTFHLFDTEAGAFVRWRVWRGLFLQGEISNEWLQLPYQGFDDQGRVIYFKETTQRGNQYAGIGWNSSRGEGGVGTEIAIFYNFAVANDINSYEQPWDYRFAITWRF
jgi:hypothetical protein